MGAGQALGCRLPVECVGAGKVGRGGSLVILGEVVLRFGVALGGGLFGPMQGGRMVMVVVVAHQADLGGQKPCWASCVYSASRLLTGSPLCSRNCSRLWRA